MQQMVMINNRPQDAYRKQDVLTASPVDLIVMLYDALKKNLVLGRRGIEKKDLQTTHKHLVKAQEIVSELMNSLDMSYPISDELLSIYDFFLTSLSEANMRKDAEPLEPLFEITDSLRSAWKEISSQSRGTLYLEEQA